MNVKELITELSKFDERARVVLPGYEDYWDDVDTVEEISLLPNAFNPRGWGGKHFDASSPEGRKRLKEMPTQPIIKGVRLSCSVATN